MLFEFLGSLSEEVDLSIFTIGAKCILKEGVQNKEHTNASIRKKKIVNEKYRRLQRFNSQHKRQFDNYPFQLQFRNH